MWLRSLQTQAVSCSKIVNLTKYPSVFCIPPAISVSSGVYYYLAQGPRTSALVSLVIKVIQKYVNYPKVLLLRHYYIHQVQKQKL